MTNADGQNAIAEFYGNLASDYDEMTGFQNRFVHEKPFFRVLVEKYRIQSAVDAGCGTGFHALLLTQLGVNVTAVDVSAKMLRVAQQHGRDLGVSIDFVESSFQELSQKVSKSFDAVLCLGNSLAHLLSERDLSAALENFSAILKPGGLVIVQNLNYDRILLERERIQSVKESNGKIFVRFYDYEASRIAFNILTLEKTHGSMTHKLQTVSLRPLHRSEFVAFLTQAGFKDIRTYGGITMEEFHPESSKDLVFIAQKSD